MPKIITNLSVKVAQTDPRLAKAVRGIANANKLRCSADDRYKDRQ